MTLASAARSTCLNDVHSGLNRTAVSAVLKPCGEAALIREFRRLLDAGNPFSTSGCRHAMGGQQFARDSACLDLRGCQRILHLDQERGLLEVEAGIQWPELIYGCRAMQKGAANQWSIVQKQTGADGFTMGGSLAANIHGRGLGLKPFVDNVESFRLILADGRVVNCSRAENVELFGLAIGGYGLFGVVSRVTVRLQRRFRLQRRVEMVHARDLISRLAERSQQGDCYGDFQFTVDEHSTDFLQWGVLSTYQPCNDDEGGPRESPGLDGAQWIRLLELAHTNRAEGFRRYSTHYLSTNGQRYWSDLHQLSPYLPDYREQLARLTGQQRPGSLMISEMFVPREALAKFLQEAAIYLGVQGPPVIYGTVRLIEQENGTFLAWARKPWACIIFNLLTSHDRAGLDQTRRAFRYLIDLALELGGSYYLTYHRWARQDQVEAAHPRFRQFLERKSQYDPADYFQSDWYRYYREMFARR